MNFPSFIALRFLRRPTESGRWSVLTFLGWLAMGVGVWAMGTLLTVMYGFEGSLRERVLKAFPHIVVQAASAGTVVSHDSQLEKTILGVDGVESATPFLETELIVQSEARGFGAIIHGISELSLQQKSALVVSGALPTVEGSEVGVLLGSELADRLRVRVGEHITLLSPVETRGAFGAEPVSRRVLVSGVFTSGHYSFDQQYIYMLLTDLQELLSEGSTLTGWQVETRSYDEAPEVAGLIQAVLPPELTAVSWAKLNSALFHSLKLEQLAMFVIFSFAMFIAVMNIGMSLTMLVVQKRKHIGMLRAMGAPMQMIRKIFIWQGIWVGGSGLLLGALLTVATLVYIRFFMTFQLPAIYYDRSIPIEIRPLSFVMIYATAVVLIGLSTLFPSARAAKLDPIEALRA